MMGANMGYQLGIKFMPGIEKLYARMPVRTNGGKWIWFKHYWKIAYRDLDSFEFKTLVLADDEYTLWLLANPLLATSGKTSWL